MSVRSLESAITAEARDYFKNRKLRLKDLREWSTSPIEPHKGEVSALLPVLNLYVCIFKEHDKRSTEGESDGR